MQKLIVVVLAALTFLLHFIHAEEHDEHETPIPDIPSPITDSSKWPKNVRIDTLSIYQDRFNVEERDAHHYYHDPSHPNIGLIVPMNRLAEFLVNNVKGSISKLHYWPLAVNESVSAEVPGTEQWFYELMVATPTKRFAKMEELKLTGAFHQLGAFQVKQLFNKMMKRVGHIILDDFHLPTDLTPKIFLEMKVVREARRLSFHDEEHMKPAFIVDPTTIVRWAKVSASRDKKRREAEVKQMELSDEYLTGGIGRLLRVAKEDFYADKRKFTYKVTVFCIDASEIPKEAKEFGFMFNPQGEELAVETFDHNGIAFEIQRTDALGEGENERQHDEL